MKILVSEIERTKKIPEDKGLLTKLSDHLAKHGWFYGSVINIVGSAVLKSL